MKYFLDTEFHEDGKTIDLISIGVVAEDGREYYAVNSDCDFDRIWTLESCQWLRDNVMPSLSAIASSELKTSKEIAAEILAFIGDDVPEFWGYYADYDWVVFCQLYGRMVDLPSNFPMYCNDLKQTCQSFGNPNLPPQSSCEHNALHDARWNKTVYDFFNWNNLLNRLR